MQVIKCLSEDIEATLDAAEDTIKLAIKYKEEYPLAAKAFYTKSTILMDSIKTEHDAVVTLIEGYKKEKGEPPAPMMAIYNYMHERHITKAAAIKSLQDMYMK
mgnify:CR=1 FL=1